MSFRTLAIAAASVLAFGASSARAADLPVKAAPVVAPVFSWAGWYAGANAGYGWGTGTGDFGTTNVGALLAVPSARASGDVKADGGLGGAQVGYNWQRGAFVFGLEADIQASGMKDTTSFLHPGVIGVLTPFTATFEEKIKWFGTLRGRLGYAFVPRTMAYVTGGLAYGGTNSSASVVANPIGAGNFRGSASDTQAGWTLGAGIEAALSDRWTIRGEYLYVDLGSTTVRLLDPAFAAFFITYQFEHRANIARIAVNYKFGPH